MPRIARVDVGGEIFHVINRANGGMQIFNSPTEYRLFENLMVDAKEMTDMRILAYVIMPNHWHLLLQPVNDGDLGLFMHRVTNAHTRQVHTITDTVGAGHLYQGRYKSFLVSSGSYLMTVFKYIEYNPVRAKISSRCEDWQWGSAWRRVHGDENQRKIIEPIPFQITGTYSKFINTPLQKEELELIRGSVNKGVPYGNMTWVDSMVNKYHLEATMRSPGRPRKG